MAAQTIKIILIGLTLGIGILLAFGAAILGWFVIPNALDDRIIDEFKLEQGKEIFDEWAYVKLPVKLKIYIFNITNPDDLENSTGEKIKLQELGPYVYDEKREKVNITSSGGMISYREKITYFFNARESRGSESDRVNTANFPFISIGHAGSSLNIVAADLFLELLATDPEDPERLIRRNVTVGDMLFNGWKLCSAYEVLHDKTPSELEGLEFGYFRTRNGTLSKEYVIKSGADGDHEHLGEIVKYDNMTELTWWNITGSDGKLVNRSQQYCNRINGSDGTIFPPFVKKDTVLMIFNPLACRSLHFVFSREVTYRDIPAYEFKIYEGYLSSPEINKEEACYCQHQSPHLAHSCPAGINRIWPCAAGAPFVVSHPHFLYGDESLTYPFDMAPANKDLHEPLIIIDPTTGAILKAAAKSQANVELQNIPGLTYFKDIDMAALTGGSSDSLFLPILWMEESAELDEENVDRLTTLAKFKGNVKKGKWAGILVGLSLIAGSLVAFAKTMA